MMIIDKWRENELRVREMGKLAREEARKAGVPSYYRDRAFGEGIVREMPDGSRQLIGAVSDEEIVKAAFGNDA